MPYSDSEARREYHRRYRSENAAIILQKQRARRQENREQHNRDDARRHRKQMRQKRRLLITELGGCCVDCGMDDERVFHLHHRDGGGKDERMSKRGHNAIYYQTLRESNLEDPGSVMILCANCHAIRHWVPDDE